LFNLSMTAVADGTFRPPDGQLRHAAQPRVARSALDLYGSALDLDGSALDLPARRWTGQLGRAGEWARLCWGTARSGGVGWRGGRAVGAGNPVDMA